MKQSTVLSVYEVIRDTPMPDDYKLVAFRVLLERKVLGGNDTSVSLPSVEVAKAPLDAWVKELASALKVSPESVQLIYELDESGILSLKAESLPSFETLTEATKYIAILLIAGRQGVRQEISTKQADVRAVVDYLRALDSANFSSTISGLKDYLSITGQGAKKSLKLKPAGYKLAATMIQETAG